MSWRRFWQRKRRDDDLAREIEFYVAHEMNDNIARGMSEDDALYAAFRRFGNPTSVREQVYEMNSLSLIESIRKDIAYGIRQLHRNPAFACSGIGILALGIAATTVIFSIAYGVLLGDLPYDQSTARTPEPPTTSTGANNKKPSRTWASRAPLRITT